MTHEEKIHRENVLARELGAARRSKAAAEQAIEANKAALVALQEQAIEAEFALTAAEGAVQEAQADLDKFRHEQSLEARAEASRQRVADAVRTAADRARATEAAALRAQEESIRAQEALAAAIAAGQEGN